MPTILGAGGDPLAGAGAQLRGARAAFRRAQAARERAAELKRGLAERRARPGVAAAIDDGAAAIRRRGSGDPESLAPLHGCSKPNPTGIADWRVAAEEINYRRFFNINELAGLRMELPELFDATHRLIFGLIDEGDLQGLRIDHIDGLADPAGYCAAAAAARRRAPLYVLGRKDPGALRDAAGLAGRRHHRLRLRQPGRWRSLSIPPAKRR